MGKKVSQDKLPKMHEEALIAKHEVKEALDNGYRLIFIDEFVVTKLSIPSHDYSQKKTYTTIDPSHYHKETLATIAGISS